MLLKNTFKILGVSILALSLSACESDSGPSRIEQTGSGAILTAPNGHTLYTYQEDGNLDSGSTCTGACSSLFPPFLVNDETIAYVKKHGFIGRFERLKENGQIYPISGSQSWGTTRRPDGTLQWTQGAFPLYTYSGDTLPGDRGGENLYSVWHIARPSAYGLE